MQSAISVRRAQRVRVFATIETLQWTTSNSRMATNGMRTTPVAGGARAGVFRRISTLRSHRNGEQRRLQRVVNAGMARVWNNGLRVSRG